MAQTLEAMIEREFTEVQKTRDDLLTKRAEIDKQLEAVEIRFTNLRNAQAALQGKLSTAVLGPRTRAPRAPSARAPRGSREELKKQIVELVKQHPSGLVSDQINQNLNATDAKKKAAIAAILSLLKKDGVIHQEQRRGPYFIHSEAAA